MKKIYLTPTVRVVTVSYNAGLLQVSNTSSNVDMDEKIQSGHGSGRARGFDNWDDDCDENE